MEEVDVRGKVAVRRRSRGCALTWCGAILVAICVLQAPGVQGEEIDPLSAECVSCHDGTTASEVKIDFRNNAFGSKSRIKGHSTDHPIGMNYGNYVTANREYKPLTMADTNMIFVNGVVGCLTCHDPMNPDRGHLAKSDRKSALCLTCHDK